MEMDTILRIVEFVVIPVVLWLIRELSTLKRDFYNYKEQVAHEYGTKEDMIRIEGKLDSFSAKIDTIYSMMIDRLPKKGGR